MRFLPDPGFAGDAGETQPALAAALSRFAVDGAAGQVLEALSSWDAPARLLIPVVASPGQVTPAAGSTPHGAGGSEGDVSTVLLRGRDGRRALLAFTSLAALTTWDASARPVPVSARTAAEAALAEGAAALLVDVAGPVPFAVESAELAELARGHRLLETSVGYGWFADWISPPA